MLYTPPSLNFVNGEKQQVFFDNPREDGSSSFDDIYLQVVFNVNHRAASQGRYRAGDLFRIDNLDPFPFFKKYSLTSSSGEETV